MLGLGTDCGGIEAISFALFALFVVIYFYCSNR